MIFYVIKKNGFYWDGDWNFGPLAPLKFEEGLRKCTKSIRVK